MYFVALALLDAVQLVCTLTAASHLTRLCNFDVNATRERLPDITGAGGEHRVLGR